MAKIERAIGIGGSVKSDEQISLPGIECIPLPENGYEICTMFEMVMSLLEAARLTGRFHYLDLVEKIFLNDVQAAVTNDGATIEEAVAGFWRAPRARASGAPPALSRSRQSARARESEQEPSRCVSKHHVTNE